MRKIVAISLYLHLLYLDNVVIALHISKRYEEPFHGKSSKLLALKSQAYIKKGCTHIQVFPVLNAYNNSFENWCIHSGQDIPE